MASHTTLTLVDGVRIVVPDSLELFTPYVLQEQHDWFEDEIKFLRRLLQPGQRIVDIGANYGTYTLSMARTVGPTGRVWAFEPASQIADLLAASIAANGFAHVLLDRSALSSAPGTARLSINALSEMNALVHDDTWKGSTEEVPLTTLDAASERHGWGDLDFMKIDAEGEEGNILAGGARFLAERSPLIQFEIKAGTDVHLELVERFAALGYRSYRLVPGLDLLVPFDAAAPVDSYLLNLFCCKPDRAQRLAADGFLVGRPVDVSTRSMPAFTDLLGRARDNYACDWRYHLATWPYGSRLLGWWEETVAKGASGDVVDALALYALSQDADTSATDRFGALEASLHLLQALCADHAPYQRLSSLARVAREFGARDIAIGALQRLIREIVDHQRVDPAEPFLTPGAAFESVVPGEALGDWIAAATLDEFERLGAFSSFYAGPESRKNLEIIASLGYASDEMRRRLAMTAQRLPKPA